jgi:hypothetical protein
MIVELNDDIEQNNIQGSLLLDHFANSLRNYNFLISLLGRQSAPPVGALAAVFERLLLLH